MVELLACHLFDVVFWVYVVDAVQTPFMVLVVVLDFVEFHDAHCLFYLDLLINIIMFIK